MTQTPIQAEAPHRLTLEGRKRLTISGVTEVVSFDDTTVLLKTTQGTLFIHGAHLTLRTLTLENGQVAVDGTVNALQYEAQREQGGFWRRLFG